MFFDGAMVSSPAQDEEIYVQPLCREVVKQAVVFAHSNDIHLELYSATHYFVEQETWASDIRRQFFSIDPVVEDLAKLWNKERIIKGGLTVSSPDEIAQARSFCHQFDGRLRFTWTKTPAYPDISFINVLAPEISKGKALEALASHLGLSLDEVMAIGDGPNDIPLLTSAGLAVAMGSAPHELKTVADHITLDIDQGGVAAAIEKFLR
jgi:Cof subfamily protein (haloacid dehalogenase superfamily)